MIEYIKLSIGILLISLFLFGLFYVMYLAVQSEEKSGYYNRTNIDLNSSQNSSINKTGEIVWTGRPWTISPVNPASPSSPLWIGRR